MAKKSTKKKKKGAKKSASRQGAKRTHTKKKAARPKYTKKQIVRSAIKSAKTKANSQKALSAEILIEKGKERGYVTYSEILKSFPHVESDISFLESLYERFSIAGVDVLEGGMLEDAADEYLATRNIKDRHSTGYDSIQIYLR